MAKSITEIEEKIRNKQAKIGVIGLGYVGLPLACLSAKKGFNVIGFDIKEERINLVNSGKSYIEDVESSELNELVKLKKFFATHDFDLLKECDIIKICVPTPVNENKEPIITYVVNTANEIVKRLSKYQIIVLKSTVFPETTEKVILPILNKSGLKVGEEFFLAFSPERIDPGNKVWTVENIPIVVGGVTRNCTKLVSLLYKTIGNNVKEVSSPRAAEMVKLLENTFRNVNIAMVNELAQLCERMKIDVWEVIEGAKTKPFGFMPFYPGPGVGGHCIPVDPYFLSWKAREYDFHLSFIELSAKINENMPYYVVEKVIDALSKNGICPSKANVLVLGVSFKKDVADVRASPAIKIIKILQEKVNKVMFNDLYVHEIEIEGKKYNSIDLTEKNIKSFDCILITTNHSNYDYEFITKNANLIVDTRNATCNINQKNIVKLGS